MESLKVETNFNKGFIHIHFPNNNGIMVQEMENRSFQEKTGEPNKYQHENLCCTLLYKIACKHFWPGYQNPPVNHVSLSLFNMINLGIYYFNNRGIHLIMEMQQLIYTRYCATLDTP